MARGIRKTPGDSGVHRCLPSLSAAEIPLREGLLFGGEASYYDVRYLILVTVQTLEGKALGRQKEVLRMRNNGRHRPLWVAVGATWGHGAWVPCGARKREVGGRYFSSSRVCSLCPQGSR